MLQIALKKMYYSMNEKKFSIIRFDLLYLCFCYEINILFRTKIFFFPRNKMGKVIYKSFK